MPRPLKAKRAASTSVTRNRQGLSTRDAILTSARRLLKSEGFQALSVDAVARAAGVTRSSVYHQFHSRDGLFLQLIAESLRDLQREQRVRRPARSALDRFLVEAEAGFDADPELLRMFYLLVFDRSSRRPELQRMLREAYRFRTNRLATGLEDDRTGLPRAQLRTLAIVLAAAFDGLYARSLIDLDRGDLKRAFRVLRELAAQQLGKKELDSSEQS